MISNARIADTLRRSNPVAYAAIVRDVAIADATIANDRVISLESQLDAARYVRDAKMETAKDAIIAFAEDFPVASETTHVAELPECKLPEPDTYTSAQRNRTGLGSLDEYIRRTNPGYKV